MSIHFEIMNSTSIDDLAPMQDGRAHRVDLVWCRSNLFDAPVFITSDLHKDALQVFEYFDSELSSSESHVIMCGDMAGTTKWGQDADPLEVLQFIAKEFQSLYFVLGNHDQMSTAITEMKTLMAHAVTLRARPEHLLTRRKSEIWSQ